MPKTKKEPETQSILDLLAAGDPASRPRDGTRDVDTGDALAKAMEGVNKRFDDLARAISQRSENIVIHTAPQQTGAGGGGNDGAPKLDTSGLPDPVDKPEEYSKALGERISKWSIDTRAFERQAAQNENQNANQITNQVEALQANFAKQYPDIAKNEDRLEFIATKVADAAAKQGVDVKRYLFTTQDQYFKDVVEEYEKVFGKAGEADGEETTNNEPPTRTQILSTGTPASLKSADPKDKPGDMIKDLQDLQRASNLF